VLYSPNPRPPAPHSQVKRYLRDINRLVCASHFQWAMWSVIQAGCSTIDFPYLQVQIPPSPPLSPPHSLRYLPMLPALLSCHVSQAVVAVPITEARIVI
jgi:hypothetical protein